MEVLETVDPDEEVLSACASLKKKGYQIALDDFTDNANVEPLTRFADFIKIDFQATPDWVRRHLAHQYASRGIKMLAEKVETPEQFQEAWEMGYSYFQGYFFCKPEVMICRDIPAYKINYLLLLQEINREEPDTARIEQILKQESSLCYKLLRYLNSAALGFAVEIRSIRHALSLLGLGETRKWISLVALAGMGDDKPKELVVSSVVRAKFCENLALKIGLERRAAEFFLMGLLSMMDAILERPLAQVLDELCVSKDIRTALLDGVNVFRYVYELVLAYERGNWGRVSQFASALRAAESAVAQSYQDAVSWGQRIFQMQVAA